MTWDQLKGRINAKGSHLLQIKTPPPDAPIGWQIYTRSPIIEAKLHEGLFTIYCMGELLFEPMLSRWTWLKRPDGGVSYATDTTGAEPLEKQLGIVHIQRMVIQGSVNFREYSPTEAKNPSPSILSEQKGSLRIECGMWIIPPNIDGSQFDVSKAVI